MSSVLGFSDKEKARKLLEKENLKINFLGAGGIGMYPLCLLSRELGYSVSGYDRDENSLIRELKECGIEVRDVDFDTELLVATLAASPDGKNIQRARNLGIPIVSRPAFLGALMEKYKTRIGVSGSHGKSTVTGMCSHIFEIADKNPTTLCGAIMRGVESPLRLGGMNTLIYEACEYKDAFLEFSPTLSVYTNLELDHVDYFKSLEDIKASFLRAMNTSDVSIINADDENLLEISSGTASHILKVGTFPECDYVISEVAGNVGNYRYKISHGEESSAVSLSILGRFNVYNSALAIAAAREHGISLKAGARAISSFFGVGRRLERLGAKDGRNVYYDYAHHPTEIRESINAIREREGGNITVIFKPHTYSRTKALFSELCEALSLADSVLLLDISAIREEYDPTVSSSLLAEKIGAHSRKIEENEVLDNIPKDSGTVVIMGAADLSKIKEIIENNKCGYP